jgi:hypothetical protein
MNPDPLDPSDPINPKDSSNEEKTNSKKPNVLESNLLKIEELFYAVFKIILIVMLMNILISAFYYVSTIHNEGIAIEPFVMSGISSEQTSSTQNSQGVSLADLLFFELLNIEKTHKRGENEHYYNSKTSLKDIPPELFTPDTHNNDLAIGQAGSVGAWGVSIPLGGVILVIKDLLNKGKITGSLQRYGSTLSLVAIFNEGRGSSTRMAWEVRRNLSNDSSSNEVIPEMMEELAFQIIYDIYDYYQIIPQPTYTNLTWKDFRNLTLEGDAYYTHNFTADAIEFHMSNHTG